MRKITPTVLRNYERYLIKEEKSVATREKYMHIVKHFRTFAKGRPLSKELAIEYKKELTTQFSPRTVNCYIAAINSLHIFLDLKDYTVKNLKIQRQTYIPEEKELTKKEYLRLVNSADSKLALIMETICGTGIRVSELQYFTKEGVDAGIIRIRLKGKCRDILINSKLRKRLRNYCQKNHISSGTIFCNRKGNPLNRSSIWAKMKELCQKTGVSAFKVFPHNLRKLFARSYYAIDRDIARLADILGHSSIETTRIYVMTTSNEQIKQIERLGLVQ